MKGIVFTELLEMIEKKFDINMVDDILNETPLKSGGAYTSIGNYDYHELIQIVEALSHKTSTPVSDIIRSYGHHLFSRFHSLMPNFFEIPKSAFEFLESVHDYIHVEVKKLYPDASLPNFLTERIDDTCLKMVYTSHCPFADFAHGLILGCIDHFSENILIEQKDQNSQTQFSRIFILKKI